MEQLASLDINYWVLQTLAMLITIFLIPKLWIDSPFGALFIVIAIAFVNSKLWDAALFFQIPDHFSYRTAMLFAANGLIFWILVKVLPGISVEGFLPAFIAPLVFTVTSLIIAKYGSGIDWMGILNNIIEFLHNLRDYFQQEMPTVSHVPSAAK